MKRGMKQLVLALSLVTATGLIAGCGSSEKAGYVDSLKIRQESAKVQDLEGKIAQRQQAIQARLQKAQQEKSPEEYGMEVQKARQEMSAFSSAMSTEYRNAVEAATAQVAKEKKLTVVLDQGAMVQGGEDITDAVLDKMVRKTATTNATDANAASGDKK